MNSSQPNQSSLSESDVELLSAYLDNQLGVAERVNLERRLEAEPALRAELAELRAVVGALRDLEPVRPPRSFTLDPTTAPRPRFYLPLTWVMQMGSGLAGLALVLLATAQLLGGGLAGSAAAPVPAAAAAPTAAVMSDASMESAPPPEAAAASTARQSEEAEASVSAFAPTPEAGIASVDEAPELPQPAADAAPPPEAGIASVDEAPEMAQPAASPSMKEPTPTEQPDAVLAAGGAPGGPFVNTAPGDGGAAAIQSSEDAPPDTAELPQPAAPEAARPQGIPPGLTLALGAALIGLAAVWHLAGRRRGA